MKPTVAITCRSFADSKAAGYCPDPGDVLRNCRVCKQLIYLTAFGQRREAELCSANEILLLCTPCTKLAAAHLKSIGKTADAEISPAAKAAMKTRPNVRNSMNEIFGLIGKKPPDD